MLVGKVIGELWTSRHCASLPEVRLLTIAPISSDRDSEQRHILVVAADRVGAGVGEQVLVAYGHAARNALGVSENAAIEAAVVGIVDEPQGES